MKNDYKHGKWKISVPPTLLISAVGKIEDISRAMTSDFKNEGDAIYVLGETKNELGGSEFYAMKNELGAFVPKVDFKRNFALYKKLQAAIEKGLLASCHDCSEGGLAIALAECCIAGRVGAEIELTAHAGKLLAHQVLFSESAGRFVVSVKKKDEKSFARAMRGAKFCRLGSVTAFENLEITLNKEKLLSLPVGKMRGAWQKTMDW
jgi:phosphoribosylformylglycinamidine synthase